MIVKRVGYATIVKIVIAVWSFVCFLGAAVWVGTADIFIPFKEPWVGAWAANDPKRTSLLDARLMSRLG